METNWAQTALVQSCYALVRVPWQNTSCSYWLCAFARCCKLEQSFGCHQSLFWIFSFSQSCIMCSVRQVDGICVQMQPRSCQKQSRHCLQCLSLSLLVRAWFC